VTVFFWHEANVGLVILNLPLPEIRNQKSEIGNQKFKFLIEWEE
jgi:hypothetical protein